MAVPSRQRVLQILKAGWEKAGNLFTPSSSPQITPQKSKNWWGKARDFLSMFANSSETLPKATEFFSHLAKSSELLSAVPVLDMIARPMRAGFIFLSEIARKKEDKREVKKGSTADQLDKFSGITGIIAGAGFLVSVLNPVGLTVAIAAIGVSHTSEFLSSATRFYNELKTGKQDKVRNYRLMEHGFRSVGGLANTFLAVVGVVAMVAAFAFPPVAAAIAGITLLSCVVAGSISLVSFISKKVAAHKVEQFENAQNKAANTETNQNQNDLTEKEKHGPSSELTHHHTQTAEKTAEHTAEQTNDDFSNTVITREFDAQPKGHLQDSVVDPADTAVVVGSPPKAPSPLAEIDEKEKDRPTFE